jgi:hypothetical protein
MCLRELTAVPPSFNGLQLQYNATKFLQEKAAETTKIEKEKKRVGIRKRLPPNLDCAIITGSDSM